MSTPWIIHTPMTNLPKSLQKQGLLGANLAHVTPLLGLSANPTPSWQVPPRNCFNGLAQGNPILTNKSLTWISVRLLSSLFGAPEQPEIYRDKRLGAYLNGETPYAQPGLPTDLKGELF